MEHVGGRGWQETAAGEGPLGSSVNVNQRKVRGNCRPSSTFPSSLQYFSEEGWHPHLELEFLPFQDLSLQAELSHLESDLLFMKYVFVISAVIKRSAAVKNADLVSYKIPRRVLTKVDSPCRRKNVRMGLDSF